MASPNMKATGVVSLADFLKTTGELTMEEREQIVEQARILINELYVHLPLKRAMHAIDPGQRLRLLSKRFQTMSERKFHDNMLEIFTTLRDVHTHYVLPEPYRSRTAFLPFILEEFWEGEKCHYIVSKIFEGFRNPHLKPGVLVTHWNGVPIERMIEITADRFAGSNPDARHARGLQNLTARPMQVCLPPDEHWVTLTFTSLDGKVRDARVEWKVFSTEALQAIQASEELGSANLSMGIDYQAEGVRQCRKAMFAKGSNARAKKADPWARLTSGADTPVDSDNVTSMPEFLKFRTVETTLGKFGYLRIWSFSVGEQPGNVDRFVGEVVRILGLLPQEGLIIDVRGNPGGTIMAGEGLLQLFTHQRIEPERLHFINTPAARDLASSRPELQQWKNSIDQAVETGATYSQGFPIIPEDEVNKLGQHYFGPVVAIIDAISYSTTDIFAAGFQDHQIGPILGTNGNTGAGGANVAEHHLLTTILEDTTVGLQSMPKGASMRIAIRRTTRVKDRAGVPLEDLGVIPDEVHKMTRRDLLENNADLIEHAAKLLVARPTRQLLGRITSEDNKILLRLETKNLDRVDVFADTRPVTSVDVEDGETEVVLSKMPTAVRLDGFAKNQIVAQRKLALN